MGIQALNRLGKYLALTAILACATPAMAQQSLRLEVLMLEAMVQRERGNDAASFDILRRCTQICPEEASAHYLLSQCYYSLKDKQKALECLEKAAALSPGNRIYIEAIAQNYIAAGDYGKAAEAYETLLTIDKGKEEEVEELLARLYMETDNYEKALDALNRLEELEGIGEELTLAKAVILRQIGDKESALRELESLANQFPNDPDYKALYADMLLQIGREDEGLCLIDSIFGEDRDNLKALTALRTYYTNKEQSEKADSITARMLANKALDDETRVAILRQEVAYSEQTGGQDSIRILNLFEAAIEAEQEPGSICLMYATYMMLKNMPQEQIDLMLEETLRRDPANASARYQLLLEAWQRDDLARTIGLCSEARQYCPEEMVFYYYQGIAFYRLDDLDGALDAFRGGISVIGQDSNTEIVSDFYSILGDILHLKGLQKEAFEAYDSCLAWKGDNFGCLNNYAYYLSEVGERLEEAERMSLRTIKAEPKNATYLDTYAWILFMLERYAEANIYIDQALDNDTTDNAVIMEHAGDIAYLNGNTEGALEMWNQALQRDPENKMLRRKIKKRKYIKP